MAVTNIRHRFDFMIQKSRKMRQWFLRYVPYRCLLVIKGALCIRKVLVLLIAQRYPPIHRNRCRHHLWWKITFIGFAQTIVLPEVIARLKRLFMSASSSSGLASAARVRMMAIMGLSFSEVVPIYIMFVDFI